MEYKSFMAEGYSIGAHAESLYGRGYKHYGTMGQGNKQVHIFTPAKGKVTHHMLLKHDGADPVRHEGNPDLKAIKAMTEAVDVQAIQEGWFTRSHPRIGNRSGSTHRVTVQHTKTGQKSTFDVTAPTNEHAVKHVINHLRTHPSVLKVTQIKHLYEEPEEKKDSPKMIKSMKEWMDLQELSKKTLKSYTKKAEKSMDDTFKNEKSPKKWDQVTHKRAVGLVRAEKRLNEGTLDIRHAVNHPDSQARHHARKFKEHSKTANDIANMRVFHDQAYDYAHHYETAQHHAKEYKKRLGQLEAGQHMKKEDLQEISQQKAQTTYRNRVSRADAADETDGHYDDHSWIELDEGLVSKITNAAKNLNKKLKPASVRIAQTREKVGYDNAKGKDLSPRGNALRKVEKIEWSKKNPVKKPKDIVPMGKLPDKIWNEDAASDMMMDEGRRRYSAEELEIRRGQKVLKELPKKGADGKLSKSKAAQRVEDCIKMSGKKQKIDTEPSYNPLVTAGGSGGSPNA
jgi:hypothetical protein